MLEGWLWILAEKAGSMKSQLLPARTRIDKVLTVVYSPIMHTLIQTDTYSKWFSSLRDARAAARINARLRRVSLGSMGDYKPVGDGVSELRIDYGPGYRVYFTRRGYELVILLAGGDKSSQERDIKAAVQLAKEL